MGKEHGIRIGTEVVYPTQKYCEIKKKIQLFLFAGSLGSANSSILAAQRFFKEVVGEKSGFYVN